MITHERLRAALDYDAYTGVFRWKLPTNQRIKAGSTAGHSGSKGYWWVTIDGRRYTAGRLAWFYVHGAWPVHQIDHIDRDKHNNSISNLRDVTDAVNKLNVDRSRVVRCRGRFARNFTANESQQRP